MAPTNWLRVYELTNGPSRNPAAADAATSLTVTTGGPNTDTALLCANTSTNFEAQIDAVCDQTQLIERE
jgi:hypothetical protein